MLRFWLLILGTISVITTACTPVPVPGPGPTTSSQAGEASAETPIVQPRMETDLQLFHNDKTSCESCHAKQRATTPRHPKEGDCSSCHSYPSFAQLKFSHSPAPASCLACHSQDRPALATHPTEGDCVSCHAYPRFATLQSFSHLPKPTSCSECHARPALTAQRAYPLIGTPDGFDPNDKTSPGSGHFVGKDCIACHQTPAEGATGFTFNHSRPRADFCLPCHFREGVAEHPNRGNVTLTGFGNCFNCHTGFDAAVGRNFDR